VAAVGLPFHIEMATGRYQRLLLLLSSTSISNAAAPKRRWGREKTTSAAGGCGVTPGAADQLNVRIRRHDGVMAAAPPGLLLSRGGHGFRFDSLLSALLLVLVIITEGRIYKGGRCFLFLGSDECRDINQAFFLPLATLPAKKTTGGVAACPVS